MKKKLVSALALMMSCVMLAACGGKTVDQNPSSETVKETEAADTESTEEAENTEAATATDLTEVKVAALKGPTAMGMVKLMDEGYGVNEGIPQLILAGASVDDVYVIVLYRAMWILRQYQRIWHLFYIIRMA